MFRRILTLMVAAAILLSIAGPTLAANTSQINPPWARDNWVFHTQSGNNNVAMTTTTFLPFGNLAMIDQAGLTNYAEQYQSGFGNEAYIGIVGNNNQTQQFQQGIGNFAEAIINDGSNNTTTEVQIGIGNSSSIIINGGNNIDICNYQQGSGLNYVHITAADGLDVTVRQVGFSW